MTNQQRQILELSKQGCSVVEISEMLGYTTEMIEGTLGAESVVKELAKRKSKGEMLDAISELFDPAAKKLAYLLAFAEDEKLQATIARYIVDVSMEIHAPAVAGAGSVTINIGEFNTRQEQAKARHLELMKRVREVTPGREVGLANNPQEQKETNSVRELEVVNA